MSNEEYFDKMATEAMEDHAVLTPDQLHRQIKLAMKEVARDVRHKSLELLNNAAQEVQNMGLDG